MTEPNASASTSGKAQEPTMVELKNGKVIFKQKPTSYEKLSETLQEIVKFREMLEQRIAAKESPLASIPDEHKPVIAKLVHESDKTLASLAKHIHQELLPTQDDDEEDNSVPITSMFSPHVVEAAIKNIASRNNYGLDGPSNGSKAPAALCVWRWEVKDTHRAAWLPKSARDKAETRIAERIQAKKDLQALFAALPQDAQAALIDPKGNAYKLLSRDTNKSTDGAAGSDAPVASSSSSSKKQALDEDADASQADTTNTAKIGRPKKSIDPDKLAKEKEKLDRKTAKAEKERKDKEAQTKSRSLMANFFPAKPKPAVNATVTSKVKGSTTSKPSSSSSATEGAVAGPSDYERTFKPFVLKKDATIAPINWFVDRSGAVGKNRKGKGKHTEKKLKVEDDVIIIDSDDDDEVTEIPQPSRSHDEDVEMTNALDSSEVTSAERLRHIISTLPPPVDPTRQPRRYRKPHAHSPNATRYKTDFPITVREIFTQLSEAELSGDASLVRALHSQLANRDIFPAKVYVFADDLRPGYFGTWTRRSKVIGPRTPFAKDVLALDYAYDSGEEWEEEEEGGDVVGADGEEEDLGVDGDEEEDQSDLDSWLVDDDQDEEQDVRRRSMSRSVSPLVSTKRKSVDDGGEDAEKKLGKKRKMVVPLVPFAKGPCWEENLMKTDYEPFRPYRIQMFNDTPFPIDPFTFVTECVPTSPRTKKKSLAAPGSPVFAVPALPGHLTAAVSSDNKHASSGTTTSSTAAGASDSTTSTAATSVPKRPSAGPKTPFPDAHLPLLLDTINTLASSNLGLIVETAYASLKTHKVKKNAIEAKVKEVGEKCKERKVWIVKPPTTT